VKQAIWADTNGNLYSYKNSQGSAILGKCPAFGPPGSIGVAVIMIATMSGSSPYYIPNVNIAIEKTNIKGIL
jgi:hypothetical protein